MKLTKTRLKQIIKEELQSVLLESEKDAARRDINAAWKSKKIDKNTWRKLRRMAYRDPAGAMAELGSLMVGDGAELRSMGKTKTVVEPVGPGGTITSPGAEKVDAAAKLVTARPEAKFGRLSSKTGPVDKTSAEQMADYRREKAISDLVRLSSQDMGRSVVKNAVNKAVAVLKKTGGAKGIPPMVLTTLAQNGIVLDPNYRAMASGVKQGPR